MLIAGFSSPLNGGGASRNSTTSQEAQTTPPKTDATENRPRETAETQPAQQSHPAQQPQATSQSEPVQQSQAAPQSQPAANAAPAASAPANGSPAATAASSPEASPQSTTSASSSSSDMDAMAKAVEKREKSKFLIGNADQQPLKTLPSNNDSAEEIQARNAAEHQLRTEQLLSLAPKNYSMAQDLFRSDKDAPQERQADPGANRAPTAE